MRTVALLILFSLLLPADAPANEASPRIEALSIRGAQTLSRAELKLLMNTRTSPWYAWLPGVRSRTFDPAAFRLDVERIRAHYRDFGYYDAEIDTLIERPAPGAVRIRIQIREGPVVRVDTLRLAGLDTSGVDVARLRQTLETTEGMPLRRSFLEADRARIQNALQNGGHAFATVAVRIAVRREAHLAQVIFHAEPGPQCRFGGVFVEGQEKTSERTIKRGLTFHGGQPYRKQALLNSQRQLYRSGAFRSVILGPPEGTLPESPVDVLVSVTERPAKSLKIGAGLATEEQVRGALAWQHRNFLGGARQFTFQTSASFLETQASVSLRQPYIWSSKNWLTVNGFVKREDRRVFRVSRGGGGVSLERNLRSSASVILNVSNEWIDFKADSSLTQFRLMFQEDTRDDLFDPRSGILASLVLEESGQLFRSNREFLRLTGEGRWYRAITRNHTLAFRVSGGVLKRLKGSGQALDFKRFYAGGSNSVRGWSLNQLGPRDPDGKPVGGQSLLEGSFEFRPRITSFLGAALFLDAGSVEQRYGAFSPGNLRWSAGAGLRYLSPVGPLRVDLAYRLSKDPTVSRHWQFYFSLGQAF